MNNGKNEKDYFKSGRGNVSTMINKTLPGTTDVGVDQTGNGAKPVYPNTSPFHEGAGPGRGH